MNTVSIFAFCIALVVSLLAAEGHARIVDCRAPQSSAYVVLLNEPEFTSAAFANREEMTRFLDRLQWQLDQERDAKWIQAPTAMVRFASCVNRAPALDGHDFDDARLVESLYNQGVLLEVWGRLDAQKQGNQSVNQEAYMNFLLIPLRFAALADSSVPLGLHRIKYADTKSPPTTDFVQLIARRTDIDAFIAAALGFKALRELNYELAHANLCQSNALLKQVATRLGSGAQATTIENLRAFVIDAAKRAVSDIRNSASYPSEGLLRLFDAKSPCAAGVKP